MHTNYKQSLTRLFSNKEKAALKAFYKSPCMLLPDELESGRNHLPCREYESLRRSEHGLWVDNLVDLINERTDDRTKPRMILRRLWEKGMLPSCQMLYLCNYISVVQEIQQLERGTKEYFKLRQSSVDRIQEAKSSIRHLKNALFQEQTDAAKHCKFPDLNHDLLSLVELIDDSLNAIEEMKRVHVVSFSLGRGEKKSPILSKYYAHLSLHCAHPGNTPASASDIVVLLPVLFEAITGEKPKKEYLADSLIEEAKRYLSEDCVRKQEQLANWIEEILPGFGDSTSSIDEMRKDMRPRAVEISHHAHAMRTLAKTYKILLKDHPPVGPNPNG